MTTKYDIYGLVSLSSIVHGGNADRDKLGDWERRMFTLGGEAHRYTDRQTRKKSEKYRNKKLLA